MHPRVVPVVCGALLAAALSAAQSPIPPAPTRWVTDTAGFMSPAAAEQLDSRLRAYEQQTHHQLIVWIGNTTGVVPIEDWAVRTFESWKVGRKGMDDGLALFIMAKDRRLRIEVGYGLEGVVPDIIASRIINDTMVPRIRAGDPDGAVTAGVEAVAETIGSPLPGAAVKIPRTSRRSRQATIGELIVYGIIGLIVLIIFATHPSLALYLLANMLIGGGRRDRDGWGGGSGGSSWGGGGWSGGGGRSGGGGASGSW